MLETWLKLGMLMVQSPQDLSQWLLVVNQIVEDRKCVSGSKEIRAFIFKANFSLTTFDML